MQEMSMDYSTTRGLVRSVSIVRSCIRHSNNGTAAAEGWLLHSTPTSLSDVPAAVRSYNSPEPFRVSPHCRALQLSFVK